MLKARARLRGNLDKDLKSFEEFVQSQVTFSGVASMAKVIYESARSYAPRSEAAHYFYGRKKGVRYGPYEPGTLHDAIYRVYAPERSGDTKRVYRIAWNHKKAPYGFMVEYGTPKAPAHPFLTPAFSAMPDAIAAGKARMRERLRGMKEEGPKDDR